MPSPASDSLMVKVALKAFALKNKSPLMFRAGAEDFVLNLLQAVCVSLLPAQEPWVASLGSATCCTCVVLCWSSAEPTSPTMRVTLLFENG